MYKTILVAVDGSDTSKLALQEAIKVAKNLGSKLYILHIADEYISNWLGASIDVSKYQDSIRQYGKDILQAMEDQARKAGVDATCQLIEFSDDNSRISEQILDYVDACRAELLVIGTHGKRGVRRILIGSVAEEVIHTIGIPVLLVRH
ncbi:MAG: universal stress protein [Gammaproteobacteria bacterium]